MSNLEIFFDPRAVKFIESLDRPRKARVDRFLDLLAEYGLALPARYLKKITALVWELRPGDVRLFLCIAKNQALIAHGIKKKGQKLPRKELKLAEKRIKEFLDQK